jgi:hypothetical protein
VDHNIYAGIPGRPVAMRRVHAENRVLNQSLAIQYQRKYLKKAMSNHFYGSSDAFAKLYLIARYVSWSGNGWMRKLELLSTPCIVLATAGYLISHPHVLISVVRHSPQDR